ncbi:DUF4165 domain-containing protein [Pseudomonas sp. CFBP 13719]|uniref:DUF4165 domain-containing protein n=1 Tax=Pseudomonas sp. CFBP 13719 TaxID=2775303 RepID=UPI001FD4587F|nr:DUF4165 domain-containing protein [Pseudomonas sp. CFBP 13719]
MNATTWPKWFSALQNMSRAAIAASVLLLLPLSAHADLVKYSYATKAGDQVTAEPGQGFINPNGSISFMISGGIDRKLRVIVTASGASSPVFTKESTKVLGADDVLVYKGNSYYAEEFVSPKLADGSYTVTSQILSSTGAIVQAENHTLLVDTAAPVAGTFAPTYYSWGEPVLTGDLWKLGVAALDAQTYSSFVLSGFSDAAGISRVAARVYRANGELYKEYDVLFSEETKTASIPYRDNFFPRSDLDEVFGVEFRVTDRAGNTTVTNRQKVMFDNVGNTPTEPFGVYDPTVTTTLAPGLKGFVPYVAGASVKTNPIRLAWRIPKTNWSTYRQGGLMFYNAFGENKVLGEDATYVYLVAALPYRAEDGNYIRFYNYGEWGSQGTISYNLVLDPIAPKTPVIQNVEYLFSDIGWSSYAWRAVSPQQLPVKITKVRYTVEPRNFDQLASHMGTCTIPAGQTQCEISVTRDLAKGTTGYLHDQAQLLSADGALTASGQWANIFWNDVWKPEITYAYNATTMILTLKVHQPQQGGYLNNIGHTGAWIENTAGTRLSVTKTLTSSAGEYFEYEFDLKTLPEGTHNLVAGASENLGAVTKLPLFQFQSDRTKPVVTVNKGSSETVDTLDKLSFSVTDNRDTAPKILSVSLTGGPAKESIALSYRKLSATTYGLEYPILFPSLTAGENYTLTVSAQDTQQNVGVGSTTFLYGPAMAGIIGHTAGLVNVPAVPTDFRRKDGSVIINSEQLKLADGTPVSGVYDLLATVRSDAVTSLRISGSEVKPGATVKLGQLDFTSTNGKISLPVVPMVRGAAGTNGVIISTSAPNSPVVYANINTWMPQMTLDINDEKPVQAMTQTRVKLVAGGSTLCQLTNSVAIAQASDPILSPVCLVEWTSVPRGLQQVEGTGSQYPITELAGRALDVGQQNIGYKLSIYNTGGEKVLLTSGEQMLSVQSANASAVFGHSLRDKSSIRAVQQVSLKMEQLSGTNCAITGDEAVARRAGADGGALTCLIQFTQAPPGLTTKSLDPLELTGILTTVGQNPIRWTASIFDTTGQKIILEQGQSTVQVVHPQATTTLEFSVNESDTAPATSIEDFPEAWTTKAFSIVAAPQHGLVVPSATGFTYTPTPGYVGSDTFTYRVTDASGMTANGIAAVDVVKFNYGPTAASVELHTREGKVSDSAAPHVDDKNLWDSHTFILTKEPTNGTVLIDGSSMAYEPNPGFFGQDSFEFSAVDQAGMGVEGRGDVTVDQFNMAPTRISPEEIVMYAHMGGSVTLTVSDPNPRDTHTLTVVHQPDLGTVSFDGRRMLFETVGTDDTQVVVRATDQDGLFIEQTLAIRLIPQPRGQNRIRMSAPISQAKEK